ncbi:MAG: Holliday junction branch migration protein RuvA [Terriglobales bacterium]
MIAFLHGVVRERQPSRVVLDVHGVGYELQVPVGTFSQLPPANAEASLHVYTHVREDAIQLFGFATTPEKLVFEKLITVNGVGPKLALSILSGLAPEALAAALQAGDHALLTAIPGVGRKTAERLVLELRDKLPAIAAAGPAAGAAAPSGAAEDVFSALVNLGYPAPQALQAVQRARAAHLGTGFDELFAACMKSL